jgi:hypothetical protein
LSFPQRFDASAIQSKLAYQCRRRRPRHSITGITYYIRFQLCGDRAPYQA